jgi:putative transposase
MKTSKVTRAQIAFVLKQAEGGAPITEVCRNAGISDGTFSN